MRKNLDTTLYFITDSTCVPEERFLPVVEAACKGGATIIQLREKDKSTREYMRLATATHEITARYGIPLIIDDRVDVALAIGAEGVHVNIVEIFEQNVAPIHKLVERIGLIAVK